MDEFALIESFFKSRQKARPDVVIGMGDDAACLQIPNQKQLLVSSDTLIANVHFHADWDAYAIAYKAVMVNVSDIAAMGGQPQWLTLALTLPGIDEIWLERFSQGLFDIALVGGDTTRGSLSLTLTIHGLVDHGRVIKRDGAKPGDVIYVSGELAAAALAVNLPDSILTNHCERLMQKLQYPKPRIDLNTYLQAFASSAIDISDGLLADLNHICRASHVGACLDLANIPIHPLVKRYKPESALQLALTGGDDYELCFTVKAQQNQVFLQAISQANVTCYPIGIIEQQTSIRYKNVETGTFEVLSVNGYNHFKE